MRATPIDVITVIKQSSTSFRFTYRNMRPAGSSPVNGATIQITSGNPAILKSVSLGSTAGKATGAQSAFSFYPIKVAAGATVTGEGTTSAALSDGTKFKFFFTTDSFVSTANTNSVDSTISTGAVPPATLPKNCDNERAAVAAAAARVGALQAAIDVFRATDIDPTLDKLNDAAERTSKLATKVTGMPFFAFMNTRGAVQSEMEKAQAEMEGFAAQLKELRVKLGNLKVALKRAQKDLDAAQADLKACLKSTTHGRRLSLAFGPAGPALQSACTSQLKAVSVARARRTAYQDLARIAPASSLLKASDGLTDASRQLEAVAKVLAANGPKAATALADTRAILGLLHGVGPIASGIASGAADIRAKQVAAAKDVAAANKALANCQRK